MWGFDNYWVWIPEGTPPGRLSRGDWIELTNGERVVILATSTAMLLVRPLRLWERVWVRLSS